MTRYLYYAVSLGLVAAAMPLRAADRPHAGTGSQNRMGWTNDEPQNLHSLGLISIVGRIEEERPTPAPAPGPYLGTQVPEWYAAQAASHSLRKTTGGINLDDGVIAITPEVAIEILERQVNEVQTEIDALEDLAHRHDIPPGTLRGQ